MGMATAKAIAEIRSVPVNTGMAPNAPPAVTWPSRIGICGSQLRPKKNSRGETLSKNRNASNRSDRTMPSVVDRGTVRDARLALGGVARAEFGSDADPSDNEAGERD